MTAFNSKEGGFYLTTVGRVQTPTLAILVEREEKIRARDAKLKQEAENSRMAKLYRKEILQEPELPGGFVAIGEIGGLGGIKPAAPVSKVEVVSSIEETVAGD